MARRSALLSSILVTAGLVLVAPAIEAHPASTRSLARLQSLRGGADSIEKMTRKTERTNTAPIKQEKKVIEDAMKEKDAAQALGDAIRYVPYGRGAIIQIVFVLLLDKRAPLLTTIFSFPTSPTRLLLLLLSLY